MGASGTCYFPPILINKLKKWTLAQVSQQSDGEMLD